MDCCFRCYFQTVLQPGQFSSPSRTFPPGGNPFCLRFPTFTNTRSFSLTSHFSPITTESSRSLSLSPIEGTDSKDLPDDIQARCRSVGRFVSRVLAVPSVGGGLRFYPGGTPCGPTHDGGPDCGFECGCVSVCWCVAGGHRFRNPWSAIAGALAQGYWRRWKCKKEGSRLCGRIFGVLTGQGGLQVRLEGSFPPKETGSGRKNRFKFHAFRWWKGRKW